MRISTTIRTGLLAAVCAGALAGCQSTGGDVDDVYTPRMHTERYPIEVKKGQIAMEVPASRSLSAANREKLLRFGQMAGGNRASAVVVSRPAGKHGHAVASEVVETLIRGGVPHEAIVMRGHGRGGSVVVAYTRTYAATKPCGNWTDDLSSSPDNGPYDNFGCAHQHNLAAMAANPEDFVIPETATPSDPMRRNQVFVDYRTPKSPATPADEQADATISEVAK